METGAVVREWEGSRAVGWRAWTVRETPAGPRLGSVIYDGLWTPRRAAVAVCRADENPFADAVDPHAVPACECGCGFHAARDPVDALSYLRGRDEVGTLGRVLGEVVLAGAILQTESGWRAAEAYPARLYVAEPALGHALAVYGVPVLSPGCAPLSSPTCTATRSHFARRWPTSSANTST